MVAAVSRNVFGIGIDVAGPRESNAPGIQASAKAFLEELLWEA